MDTRRPRRSDARKNPTSEARKSCKYFTVAPNNTADRPTNHIPYLELWDMSPILHVPPRGMDLNSHMQQAPLSLSCGYPHSTLLHETTARN